MPATIDTARERIRRDLRNTRRIAYAASTRHDAIAFGRATHLIEELERLEDDLLAELDTHRLCECGRDGCRGSYKPDSSHELAF